MAKGFTIGESYDLLRIVKENLCRINDYKGESNPCIWMRFDIKEQEAIQTFHPKYNLHIGIRFEERTDYWDFVVEGGRITGLQSILSKGFFQMSTVKPLDPDITICADGSIDERNSQTWIRIGNPFVNPSRVFLHPPALDQPAHLRMFFPIRCVAHLPIED